MKKESPQKKPGKKPQKEPQKTPQEKPQVNGPGKKTEAKKRRHSSRMGRYVLNGLFVLFVCVILYLIIYTFRGSSEFPKMRTGQVLPPSAEELSSSEPLPAETVPSEETTAEITTEAPEETSTEAPGETSTEAPTEEPSTEAPAAPEELAREALQDLSLEEKVWQMMFLSPGQMQENAGSRPPAGAVYFGPEDLTEKDALSKTMDALQQGAKVPLLLGVSEEGGSAAPLSALGITDAFPPMSEVGTENDAGKAEEIGKALGLGLKEAGFHFNLAPLADVVTNNYNSFLGDRPFSRDENICAAMVAAVTEGMQESGTAACLTHFPDFGSAAMENNRIRTYRLLSDMKGLELVPFRAGIDAGAEMVLVSNIAAPGITGSNNSPCSMSRSLITDCLRGEMGFQGIILSDFQNEDYILRNYDPGEAAVSAISAGCDAVLLSADPAAAVQAVLDAVADGTLTEQQIEDSAYRILLLKCRCGLITE